MKELWEEAENCCRNNFFYMFGRDPTDEEVQDLMMNGYFKNYMAELTNRTYEEIKDREMKNNR